MKCIWYWIWEKEETDKREFADAVNAFENAKTESPEAFPRISKGMSYYKEAGFKLVDGTHEQLLNFTVYWRPIRGWQLLYFEQPDMLIPFTA